MTYVFSNEYMFLTTKFKNKCQRPFFRPFTNRELLPKWRGPPRSARETSPGKAPVGAGAMALLRGLPYASGRVRDLWDDPFFWGRCSLTATFLNLREPFTRRWSLLFRPPLLSAARFD